MKPKTPGPAPASPTPAPGDHSVRSGEGSKSALEALIRKRKEAPDEAAPAAPLPPPA